MSSTNSMQREKYLYNTFPWKPHGYLFTGTAICIYFAFGYRAHLRLRDIAGALMEYCIQKAKEKGKSGICVLSSPKKKGSSEKWSDIMRINKKETAEEFVFLNNHKQIYKYEQQFSISCVGSL